MEKEQQLLDNITEYLDSAKEAKSKGRINSTLTLLFKAVFIIIDLYILKQEGFIPSNHSERFRILDQKYHELYKILDKNFPVYQNSYRIKLTKEHLEVLEDDIRKISEFTKIKINY